jgi:hypothetical protein
MPRGDGTGPAGTGRGGGRGMGQGRGKGKGRGRMGGQFAAWPGGYCVCPKCGKKVPHIVGEPCNKQSCPECGTIMTRE